MTDERHERDFELQSASDDERGRSAIRPHCTRATGVRPLCTRLPAPVPPQSSPSRVQRETEKREREDEWGPRLASYSEQD
jgi:hypothetical protein